jgi:hypothetical protein
MAFRTLLRSSSIQEPRYPLSSVDFIHSLVSEKRKKTDFNQSIKNRKVIKIHQASTTCFFHQSINLAFLLSINQRKKEKKVNQQSIILIK